MPGRLLRDLRGWRAIGLAAAALAALLSSVFAGVLIVDAMNPDEIEILVFHDEVGDALLDGAAGDAVNPGLAGVDVLIFRDDGSTAGIADAGDTKVGATLTTDASGVVTVGGLVVTEDYWVAIDARTIDAPQGSSGGGGAWLAEQTYGPAGSHAVSGSLTTVDGPLYGGRDAFNDDDTSDAAKANHIALLTPGGPVGNFGFSFNVVTSERSSEHQGSFQQFVQNANDIEGPNAMRFVPAVAATGGLGPATYWIVDPDKDEVFLNDDETTIDGTAFAPDGSILDTNPGSVSVNGGQPVGTRNAPLAAVRRPELAIFDSSFTLQLGDGNLPAKAQIRNLHILPHDDKKPPVGVVGMSGELIPDVSVSGIVVGTATPLDLAPAPVTNLAEFGSYANFAPNFVVENSYLANSISNGLEINNSPGAIVRGNEIVNSGADGYNTIATSTSAIVEANRFEGSVDYCVDSFAPGAVIRDNTFFSCGDFAGQSGGVRVGDNTATVEFNSFEQNNGPGIVVAGQNSSQSRDAGRAVISQNVFLANAGIAIDLALASNDNLLNGDGISVNDSNIIANAGNAGLDYPTDLVIDAGSGGQIAVKGTACANCRVEVFQAVGGPDDVESSSGLAHGEGARFLGAGNADGSGAFSIDVPAAGVSEISATATDLVLGATSEFSPNLGVEILGGRVLIDENADADLSDSTPAAGVTVRVYEDLVTSGGQELPEASDPLVATLTTGAQGDWTFSNATAANYWVTVDSRTIAPASLNAGTNSGWTWADQTYGPAGSLRADGSGGVETSTLAGPAIGGRSGAGTDDASTLATSEHVFRIEGAAPSLGLDTAFSFNVVTNTAGGDLTDLDPIEVRSQQGTLRQFVFNAEAIAGPNLMRFVPAVATNAGGGGLDWWRIALLNGYPQLNDDGTAIDGQAFARTAPGSEVDPSAGDVLPAVGAGRFGTNIPPVDIPELEIWGDRTFDPGMDGFALRGDSTSVSNMAFLGFRAAINVNDDTGPGTNISIQNNAFGFDLATSSDPGASSRLERGVNSNGGTGTVVRSNAFGFTGGTSVDLLTGSADYTVELNRFVRPAITEVDNDAVTIFGAGPGTVRANHVLDSAGFGIDVYRTAAAVQISDNTIDGFGLGGLEEGGIRVFGTGSTVDGNRIENGIGSPVVVVGDYSATSGITGSPAVEILITNNIYGSFASFSGGGPATAIDLVAEGPQFSTDFGDGPSANTGTGIAGDCGYEDLAGNRGIDYPEITVQRTANRWDISGSGCAGASVQLYGADSLGGPPTIRLGSVSVAPSGDIKASLNLTSSPQMTATFLAASQINSRNTSEFAPAVAITGDRPPVITNPGDQSAIEYDPFTLSIVGSDPDGDPLFWDLVAPVVPGMTIDSGTGALAWTPGEADGGTTVPVTVSLLAGGITVQETFNIVVAEFDNPPTLTNPGPQTATEFVPFSLTVEGGDVDSPFTWGLNNGPTGLTIDPVTGVISWTPGEADGGTTPSVSVRLSAGSTTLSTSFTIDVAEVNDVPIIDDPGPQTATEFSVFSNQLTGSDPEGDPLVWALVSGPAGLTVSPTGLVEWSPSESFGGTTQFVNVSLTAGGQTVQGTHQISVVEDDQAPVVTPPPTAAGTTGVLLSAQANGVDPDTPAAPLSWSLVGTGGGTVPNGMTIDAVSGLVSFTPTAAGPFTVDIVASQPNALSGQATWTGAVADPVGPPPVVTSPAPSSVSEGQTATLTFTASNATSFSLVSGPTGASINPATGVVTWPTNESHGGSVFTFVVEAGGPGGTGSGSSTVTVLEDNQAPVINPIANRSAVTGERLEVPFTISDPDRPRQTLSVSVLSGPTGLLVDAANNRLLWPTAGAVGSYPVRVRVSDSGSPSRSADATFTISVTPVPTTTTLPPTTPPPTSPATSRPPTTRPAGGTTSTSTVTTIEQTTTVAPTTETPPTVPPSTMPPSTTPPAPGAKLPSLPFDKEVALVNPPVIQPAVAESFQPTLSLASGVPGLLKAPAALEIPPRTVGLAGAWIFILGVPLVLWERKRAVSVVAGVDANDTLPVFATRNSTYPFAYLRPDASMLWSRYRFFGLGEGQRVKVESPLGPVWVERKHLQPLHEPIAVREAELR